MSFQLSKLENMIKIFLVLTAREINKTLLSVLE